MDATESCKNIQTVGGIEEEVKRKSQKEKENKR